MPFFGILKVGLLALLESLDLVSKEVSDRAAIEYLQKYGMPQPASDDGFGYRSDEQAFFHPGQNIPDPNHPGLNILGTPLRSGFDR
jgi:hypothetical protein